MKFMFVTGGSYKRFYINELSKIKDIDLLIFHQNIFYDFDYEQEYLGDALITKELIGLNSILNCPIVVYGCYKLFDIRKKCFIVCINRKVSVIEGSDDIYLYIKSKLVLIGNKIYKDAKYFSTISIVDKRNKFEQINKKLCYNYFICDKKGVTRLQGSQIYRKFQKCCYFSLCYSLFVSRHKTD